MGISTNEVDQVILPQEIYRVPFGSFSWEISEEGPAMSQTFPQHDISTLETSNDKWNNGPPVITASTASHSKSSALNQNPL
ncbi:hypothetical protein BHYA_0012g00070 [Botrytis hyacinthi]|uniref:Uncharacterized protein n=1 Tax=Botrytis hyacinthi TaxID=278943 RepID=A0A4Z1HAD7_9HELO|nr:hypothetical protein BHYA_0012g00070 [Botrytis hyacinthi]